MRIALPKGRLFHGIHQLLWRTGVKIFSPDDRTYNYKIENLDFCIKKVRAIPQLIALGNFQVGFCGLDLIRETNYENVIPLLDLQINQVKIVAAEYKRPEQDSILKAPIRPIVIATEYEHLADQWALKRSLAHITIQTWGSTEGYAPIDADIVFDCVETGKTLAANGLMVVDEIMTSSTYLVANKDALVASKWTDSSQEIETLVAKLKAGIPR